MTKFGRYAMRLCGKVKSKVKLTNCLPLLSTEAAPVTRSNVLRLFPRCYVVQFLRYLFGYHVMRFRSYLV